MHKPSVKLHFIFFNYFKGNYFIAVSFLLYILMDYVSFCQFNWQIFCSIKESSSIHWKFPICTRREFSSTWPQRLFLKQPFFFFFFHYFFYSGSLRKAVCISNALETFMVSLSPDVFSFFQGANLEQLDTTLWLVYFRLMWNMGFQIYTLRLIFFLSLLVG